MVLAEVNETTYLLIFTITILGSIFAFLLLRIYNQISKYILYDRRMAVYQETIKFLSLVQRDKDISNEDLLKFRTTTKQNDFLYGKEIKIYLNEIYEIGKNIVKTSKDMNKYNLEFNIVRDKFEDEHYEYLSWLIDQLPIVEVKFKKYLNL